MNALMILLDPISPYGYELIKLQREEYGIDICDPLSENPALPAKHTL